MRRYIDKEARFGQIKPGYRADLILLDENPLEDVRNARTVSAVAVNGRLTDKSAMDQRRDALKERYAYLNNINGQVDAALTADNSGVIIQSLMAINEGDPDIAVSVENRINAAGYAAAYAGDLNRSQVILGLNTELFPNSANTWDSLAEVVLYMGDGARALEYYRKALEVDPPFTNAAENIEKILNENIP